MQLPNDVVLYLENCEEQGFVPGAEEFGAKFDSVYGIYQVDQWIQELGIPERKHGVDDYGSLVNTYYKEENEYEVIRNDRAVS